MGYRIRRSFERKYLDHGWLKTYHTFSFASYYDPQFMGFRDLRVINEDRVAPGYGFPLHEHKDMEIISLVLDGELEHQDSMGHKFTLRPYELQAMSAGSGITHSESNPSEANLVHFLQIWIMPDTNGVTPRYQQTILTPYKANQWLLVASKNGRDNSMQIYQDVDVYFLSLDLGIEIERQIPQKRYGWLQVIDGGLQLYEDTIHAGDGIAIDPNTFLKIRALAPSRLLFFDLK